MGVSGDADDTHALRKHTLLQAARYALIAAVAIALAQQLGIGSRLVDAVRTRAENSLAWGLANLRADPEEVHIQIKPAHLLELSRKREEALKLGVLVSSSADFVPARIHLEGGTPDNEDRGNAAVDAKVRLKGDLSDHWSGSKWSLRVVVKGDETLLGMKQFSLQHPRTRGYLDEWLLHEMLRREGLPALRYRFVRVFVNGEDRGIYALEEHFEKRLIEHSRRREGPIVRFNEDLCWAEIVQSRREGPAPDACRGSGSGSYLAADLDAFQTGRLLDDPELRPLHARALLLLELFRRGELTTSEVFDAKLLARHFAILELTDRLHAAYWRNARFYYNPITGRLEPIAFDGGSDGQPSVRAPAPALRAVFDTRDRNNYYYHMHYLDSIFSDPTFFAEYIRALERATAEGHLEGLLEEMDSDLRSQLTILQSEYPSTRFSDRKLRERRRFLRGWLNPPKAIHVHLEGREDGRVRLAVGNLQYLPIEILGLRDGNTTRPPEDGVAVLPGREAARPVDYVELSFPLAAEAKLSKLRLRHRIPGASDTREASLFRWPQAHSDALGTDPTRREPNPGDFEFLVVDEAAREIRVRPGRWRVDHDLIVPPGQRLRAGPGTELDLVEGALILSYSPVELVGTEERPVVVGSRDGRGQGLTVIRAGGRSLLEHVRFEGLTAPDREGWQISGGVTFYESPVTISRSRFLASRAEDALHLFRSDFSISDTLFRDAAGDALDADFSDGILTDCAFLATGNDAVDLSGSLLRATGLQVTGAGDKAISAGELSEMWGSGIRIRQADIGVASKDLSRVELETVRIAHTRIGLAVFRKKPEFGPGRITVSGLELEAVERPYQVEEHSRLVIDGVPVEEDASERREQARRYDEDRRR